MKGELLSIDTVERIADLEKRIAKAIKYLEDREYDNMCCSVCSVMSDKLLDILRGDTMVESSRN